MSKIRTRISATTIVLLMMTPVLAQMRPYAFKQSRPSARKATRTSASIDEYLKQQMTKHQIPGMSVAVVQKGEVLKLSGYGLASVEFDVPADSNTVFQLFSVSKIFAGVAVLKLVEDGKLSLDSPITDFIADSSAPTKIPAAWKLITVRHLLSHTSGLPEVGANSRYACLPEDRKKGITAEEEIAFMAELPLKFSPGEKWAYHVSGYHLLSYIVARVAQKSYADFLVDRVFTPLGMNASRFGSTEAAVIRKRSPTSYSRESGQLSGWIYPFSVRDYPAAGLNSSAADLAKFLVALNGEKVLKPDSLEKLWAKMRLADGTEKGYGLGWTVGAYQGRKVVGHEGGGAIWVAHFPAEQLSIVVLCNLNGARADEIQYGIADFYLN